jgi:hypothetical protein
MSKKRERISVDVTDIDSLIEKIMVDEGRTKTATIRVLIEEAIALRTNPESNEVVLQKAIALLKKAAQG